MAPKKTQLEFFLGFFVLVCCADGLVSICGFTYQTRFRMF